MANIKFSDFTANATIVQADHFLVGFDDDDRNGGANPKNNKWTFPEVAAGLAAVTATPYSIYAANGTMPTDATRTVTAAGTSNFIFTGGTDNTIQIGNLVTTAGIGWKIQPGTASRMYISDTNGRPILSKYYDIYNNHGSSARAIALGIGTSDVDGGDRIAINQPNTFSNNTIYYTASNTDGSSLWVFGGKGSGSVYNTRAITAFGPMGNSSETMYALALYSHPGATVANPYSQDLFKVSNAGTVEIGSTGQYQAADGGGGAGTALIPEPVLKVNGQAYSVLYAQPDNNLTFDWNDSNVQTATGLTGSHTFTASNPRVGATYIISLAQTGTVTATWTGVKWPAATAPTLSGAGKTDVVTLICYDATGAGLYYGASTLNFTT